MSSCDPPKKKHQKKSDPPNLISQDHMSSNVLGSAKHTFKPKASFEVMSF